MENFSKIAQAIENKFRFGHYKPPVTWESLLTQEYNAMQATRSFDDFFECKRSLLHAIEKQLKILEPDPEAPEAPALKSFGDEEYFKFLTDLKQKTSNAVFSNLT
jgi:hypothetical protein